MNFLHSPKSTRHDHGWENPLKMSIDCDNFQLSIFAVPLNTSIESFAANLFLKKSTSDLDQNDRHVAPDDESEQPKTSDHSYVDLPPVQRAKGVKKKTTQNKRNRKDPEDLNRAETKTQKVAEQKLTNSETKKLERQEKNRLAAQRSRQSKKEHVAFLEKEVAALTEEKERLQERIRQFQESEAQMKQKVQRLEGQNAFLLSRIPAPFDDPRK